MRQKKESTTTLVKKEEVRRNWYLFDASGKTLGRFCTEISKVLRGKHKPSYTPHVDNGDGVIVVNVEKIRITGAKEAQKIYRYYTGHIGGQREISFRQMKDKNPAYIIRHAVSGMLPKNRLGKQQLRRLRLFKGNEDTSFAAQQPVRVGI